MVNKKYNKRIYRIKRLAEFFNTYFKKVCVQKSKIYFFKLNKKVEN